MRVCIAACFAHRFCGLILFIYLFLLMLLQTCWGAWKMKAVFAPLPKGSLARAGDGEMLTSLGCPTGTGVGLAGLEQTMAWWKSPSTNSEAIPLPATTCHYLPNATCQQTAK